MGVARGLSENERERRVLHKKERERAGSMLEAAGGE